MCVSPPPPVQVTSSWHHDVEPLSIELECRPRDTPSSAAAWLPNPCSARIVQCLRDTGATVANPSLAVRARVHERTQRLPDVYEAAARSKGLGSAQQGHVGVEVGPSTQGVWCYERPTVHAVHAVQGRGFAGVAVLVAVVDCWGKTERRAGCKLPTC